MTKKIVSAIKSKRLNEIVAEILRSDGLDAEATEMESAGRMTVALIDRTCKATDLEESEKVEAPKPEVEKEEELKEHGSDGLNDVRKAIEKGKGKKALKLIKAHKENGLEGPVLSGLKKEAEAL